MTSLLGQTIERFYELNVGVVGRGSARHERPHKPLLLLVVLDLLDEGLATPECIEWNSTLRERFSRYFDAVKALDDRDTPENPFRHLAGDGFWQVLRRTASGAVPHEGDLRVRDSGQIFARLVDGVDRVLANPRYRIELRAALIARYFPHAVGLTLAKNGDLQAAETAEDETAPGRSAGFRRKVIEVYDHQCAACGLRIRLQDGDVAFVDAAHLIPFSVSRNDHPTNGIALCKNHHWAMDRQLIAPSPSGVWFVAKILIPRRSTGEAELVKLAHQPVLPPADEAFRPDPEAMKWRVARLIS